MDFSENYFNFAQSFTNVDKIVKNINSINILCGLIILIMTVSVIVPVYRFTVAFGYGFSRGIAEGNESDNDDTTLTIPVDVAFSHSLKDYTETPDSLMMADGKDYPMILSKSVVLIPISDNNSIVYLIRVLLQLVTVMLTLVLITAVVKFTISINRGHVFEIINVKRLARIGWLLLSISLAQVLFGLLSDIIIEAIAIKSDYYTLQPNWTFPVSNSVIGLFSLMFAAIWKRGIALQREQELTI